MKIDVNKLIDLLTISNCQKLKLDWIPLYHTKERKLRYKQCIKNFTKRCNDYKDDKERYCNNINKKKYRSFNVDECQETWQMSWLHLHQFLEFYFKQKWKT